MTREQILARLAALEQLLKLIEETTLKRPAKVQ